MPAPITLDEVDAALTAAAIPRPALDADMGTDELLEIAAELDERGPLPAIKGLLEGLRIRHIGDDTTLAALAAVEHYHLPALIDSLKA